jgi:DNA polymerase III delta prime subunit
MDQVKDQFLWVESYRPQKLDDCILTDEIRSIVKGFVDQGRLPNLLFEGSAGTGKTTVAKAMCNEVGADWIIINGSLDFDKDLLRNKITNFASTVSFSDSKKVVIIDEADYLSAQHVQPGLRAFMEQFSSNCSFILTCNYKNRLIDPIHSRCKVVSFKITNKEKPELATAFFKRATQILKTENVEFDKKVVAELINKYFPDFRRCLNELQSYSATGKIDSGILVNLSDDALNNLFLHLKSKKFNDVRKWVAQTELDTTHLFRSFYDKSSEKMEPKAIPALILLLGQYSYRDAFVADKEINMMAFLTEVMMSSDIIWK